MRERETGLFYNFINKNGHFLNKNEVTILSLILCFSLLTQYTTVICFHVLLF